MKKTQGKCTGPVFSAQRKGEPEVNKNMVEKLSHYSCKIYFQLFALRMCSLKPFHFLCTQFQWRATTAKRLFISQRHSVRDSLEGYFKSGKTCLSKILGLVTSLLYSFLSVYSCSAFSLSHKINRYSGQAEINHSFCKSFT